MEGPGRFILYWTLYDYNNSDSNDQNTKKQQNDYIENPVERNEFHGNGLELTVKANVDRGFRVDMEAIANKFHILPCENLLSVYCYHLKFFRYETRNRNTTRINN